MLASVVSSHVLLDGTVLGLIYGLLAMSIVLVYRSTRVVNFAVGNMGLVGAGLLVICNVNYRFPYWLSLGLALIAGVSYGAAVELVVIRRLYRAPRVIVLVATIGVAQLSLAILSAYPDLLGAGKRFPQMLSSSWYLGEARITGSQLLVIVVVPLAAVLLGWFLNRTLLGRAVRAASVNPDLARLRGISPKNVSTFVWSISGLVGTIAMILIGSLSGSASTLENLGPNTLLRALAAAVIARLSSFRTALVAGVLLGIGEGVIRFNFLDQPGLVDVALLVVVVLVVTLQSRRGEGGNDNDSAFSFAPKVDALPSALRSKWWISNISRCVVAALFAIAALLPLVVTKPSRLQLFAVIAAYSICALSLTVLTGWAGQLSLGQMALAGVGAFTAAALTRGMVIHWAVGGTVLIDAELYPVPFAAAVLVGAVIAALVAVVVGAGALRVKGLLLAVTTFAFAVTASTWIYPLDIFSGGAAGTVGFTRGTLFGIDLTDQRTYYYVVLVVLAATVAVLGRVRRSGAGRVTIAVRDNADAAASYTVRPSTAKIRIFALAGFVAGAGGALLGGALRQIPLGNSPFAVDGSLTVVAIVVIGGMSSTAGAVLGAIWVVGLPALFPQSDLVPLLSSSLGLLVLLMYFPGGFAQLAYDVRGALYRRLMAGRPTVEKSTTGRPVALATKREESTTPVILNARDVTVAFGGVRANDGVSISVGANEIVGLIGTNGAGKSTFMNAIGGFVRSSGTVEFMGQDFGRMSVAGRARRGLGRTFQAATLFPELTVRETVEVALEARGRSGLLETIFFSPRGVCRERTKQAEAAELVDFLGLGRYADKPIGTLSTGTRRIVELAGLLALDARLLCLDEPTAGVAQREAEAMGPLLVEIRRHLGASMLVIEHDMPLIMGMSDRVYCLDLGRVIAEGTPTEVRNDPKVIASYLGTDERSISRSDSAPASTTASS